MSEVPQPSGSPSVPPEGSPSVPSPPPSSVPPPPPELSKTKSSPPPQSSQPPAPIVGTPPRKAASWTGVLIAIGGVLALVAGFLQYAKVELAGSSYAFTGLGSETVTGMLTKDMFKPGNPGRTLFVIGIVLVVLGLLVVARLGRSWVGIVALVASVIGVVLGIVALAEPSRDADSFRSQLRGPGADTIQITGSIGIGAILATIGAVVALAAAILALVVRPRATREPVPDDALPPTAGEGPEPGLAS